MSATEPSSHSPILIEESDQQSLDSCSFDSACALKPKDRLQIAAMAILGIGIMSLAMYGFYWLGMKFL
jgi:hypothetical protein